MIHHAYVLIFFLKTVKIHPLIARRIILWASLAGLFVSTYLLITYVSGAPIVCGTTHGCELVRASKWAYTMGLPRPLLGVVFYVGLIALLALRAMYPRWQVRWMYRLSMLAAFVGFIESAFLTFVQWLDIKAFCIWCITSAVAATIIFIASWWDRPVALEDEAGLRELKFIFWSFVGAVVVGAVLIGMLVASAAGGDVQAVTSV